VGAKIGEICFLPLEIEKTTFFANNFKIQEGLTPPSDAHGHSYEILQHFAVAMQLVSVFKSATERKVGQFCRQSRIRFTFGIFRHSKFFHRCGFPLL